MESARLAALSRLYIAGELSSAERDELYRLLMSSPSEREQFDRRVAWFRMNNPGVYLPFATEFIETHVPQRDVRSILHVVAQSAESPIHPLVARIRDAAAQQASRMQSHVKAVQQYFAGLEEAYRAATLQGAEQLGTLPWVAKAFGTTQSAYQTVSRTPSLRYFTAGTLAALAILAVVMVFNATSGPTPTFPVPAMASIAESKGGPALATLLHSANVQWVGTKNEVFVGETFGRGELSLAAGVVQLEFKRGARLVVEGPARLQLISDNEAYLYSGTVTAHVPTQATGFRVTAPAVTVKDIGTEFGLRAGTNAPSELHVFTGVVEMARPASSSQRMTEGEAALVKGRRVSMQQANPSQFMFEPDVLALEREEQRARFLAWNQAARALGSDPAALVHYTFQDDGPASGRAANLASNVSRLPSAIAKGALGAGRWPDKRALHFKDPNHRLRFNVPNTLTSLTYMAWLRVDSLNSVSNALAITENGQLGEVHWQIYRDGRVALSAHSGIGGKTVDDSWDRGLSPKIFTPETLGRWLHLTSVYESESQSIKHYVNGEFLSATPIKRPIRLKLGDVEVANWGSRTTAEQRAARPEFYNRYWTGCLDEFALLGRAMSADEIRAYYRKGRIAAGVVLADAGN